MTTATLSPNPDSGAVSTPPGQEAPTQQQPDTQPPAPTPNPNRPTWADQTWTDADQRAWDAKGFKTPLDVWKWGSSAEKVATNPFKVALPKPGDEAAQKEFFKAIGVPDTADKYEITVPEQNGSQELADGFRTTAHKLGLTPTQVKGLNEFWNGFIAQTNAKTQELSDQEFDQMVSTGKQKLQTEWGANYEKNYGAAQRALAGSGLTGEQALAVETVLGTETMLRMFSKLGLAAGEKAFVDGGGTNPGGRLTVDEARGKIAEIQRDQARYDQLSRDLQARRDTPDTKLWRDLHTAMAG